jgi:hypothetical protein
MSQLIDEPTEAQIMASVLSGKGTTRYIGTTRAVLSRIPEPYLAEIDAMAKLADKSRSAMVVHLLAVALQEVRRVSDPATIERIDAETFAAASALANNQED